MSKYSVYCHTFPDGKRYIGITSQEPKERWGNNGIGYKGMRVYDAVLQYGWDNIKHEILAHGLTKAEADAQERKLICQYDSIRNGYNVATGGSRHKSYLCEPLRHMYRTFNRHKIFEDTSKEGKRIQQDSFICGILNELYEKYRPRDYELDDPVDCARLHFWLRHCLDFLNEVTTHEYKSKAQGKITQVIQK